jgi:hypothetical protein
VRKVVYLTNSDHQHHVTLVTHDSADSIEPTADGGYRLPADATEVRIYCQFCDCVLMEREDYEVREVDEWAAS